MSVVLGRTLDYLPFLLVTAVVVGLLTGQTEGTAGFAIMSVPLVVSLLLAVVEWYRRG